MKHLLIIGARGYGREVYNTAMESIGYGEYFDIKGFLDDKSDALDGYEGYSPIIDSVENYEIDNDDVFVCALGDVKYKKHYVDLIRHKGGEFFTLIHKTAYIGKNTEIGVGCILSRYDQISCDVKIGDFVTMNHMVIVGHDAEIGDFSHLNCNSFMGGYAKLEKSVTLQTSAKIMPHKKCGNYSTVGVCSVVLRNVKEGKTVYGNPASEIDF